MDTVIAAWLHYLLAFLVIGLLSVEIALLRPGMGRDTARLIGRIDMFYGLSFLTLFAVGIARVGWYEKGWDYYQTSGTFWVKMGLLALITALSLPPTFRYTAWNRRAKADPGFHPPVGEVKATRRLLIAQAVALAAVPLFAGLMARGY